MYRVLNYCFIICLNLLLLLINNIDASHIIFFSLACILLFSSEFIEPKLTYFLISYAYLFLCFFYPIAFLFLPIASYAHARMIGKLFDANIFCPFVKFTPFLYLPIFIVMWDLQTEPTYFQFFFILFICALSFLLEYQAYSYEHLSKKYILSYDATRERNLHLNSKNKALVAKQNYEISLATMKERNRIARDIHDNVGHLLTRSILITGAIKTINADPTLRPSIESLDISLNNAMTTIRESVHDLHSQSLNLQDSIQIIVDEFTFCKVSFTYKSTSKVPMEIYYSCISIIKEALTNTAKHSNATEVSIRIQEHPGLYQLILEDNGTTSIGTSSSGMGLENMQERVKKLQGNFHVRTNPGFRIFITIPKGGKNE